MKILVTSNNEIFDSASSISFGAWEERDVLNGVIVHKWKLEDETGNTLSYVIDENQNSITGAEEPICTVVDVEVLPADFVHGKYLYLDGEVVVNPEWTEPPKSDAERIAELEAQIDSMANAIVEGVNEV